MKDWKSTLTGLIIGVPALIDALITAYTAGQFEGKNTIQLCASIGIILLGWIVADKKAE